MSTSLSDYLQKKGLIDKLANGVYTVVDQCALPVSPSSVATIWPHVVLGHGAFSKRLRLGVAALVEYEKAVIEEYRQLYATVMHYDDLYRRGTSPVSDEDYDAWVKRLDELDRKYPGLRELTGEVEQTPAWSLDRTFDEADVRKFDRRVRAALSQTPPNEIEFVAEPKIDGVSLRLIYRKGYLESVMTRGKGGSSQDVTAMCLQSSSAVKHLFSAPTQSPDLLELRGEAIVTLSTLNSVNHSRSRRGWEVFRTARNLVTGILSRRDGWLVSEQPSQLEIHVFEVLQADVSLPGSYSEMMAWLENLGLKTVPDRMLCQGIDRAIDYYTTLLKRREDYGYEMDGIVIKVNKLSWQRQLGDNIRRSAGSRKCIPNWALAYKFPYHGELARVLRLVPSQRQTKANLLEVELGFEGQSKPVLGILNPKEGPDWTEIVAGDVVRVERPLGKRAEVLGIKTACGSPRDSAGMTFALVGKLSTMEPSLAKDIILGRQGRVAEEVSDQIDFAVTGSELTPEMAVHIIGLGAQIVTEREFLAMMGLELPTDGVLGPQLTLL